MTLHSCKLGDALKNDSKVIPMTWSCIAIKLGDALKVNEWIKDNHCCESNKQAVISEVLTTRFESEPHLYL